MRVEKVEPTTDIRLAELVTRSDKLETTFMFQGKIYALVRTHSENIQIQYGDTSVVCAFSLTDQSVITIPKDAAVRPVVVTAQWMHKP